jgi:hypothetical protein
MTVIDAKFLLEVLFELINHHIFGCFLHFLENFIQVVMMLIFFTKIRVIVSIIEEDKLEFLTRSIELTIFQL